MRSFASETIASAHVTKHKYRPEFSVTTSPHLLGAFRSLRVCGFTLCHPAGSGLFGFVRTGNGFAAHRDYRCVRDERSGAGRHRPLLLRYAPGSATPGLLSAAPPAAGQGLRRLNLRPQTPGGPVGEGRREKPMGPDPHLRQPLQTYLLPGQGKQRHSASLRRNPAAGGQFPPGETPTPPYAHGNPAPLRLL